MVFCDGNIRPKMLTHFHVAQISKTFPKRNVEFPERNLMLITVCSAV